MDGDVDSEAEFRSRIDAALGWPSVRGVHRESAVQVEGSERVSNWDRPEGPVAALALVAVAAYLVLNLVDADTRGFCVWVLGTGLLGLLCWSTVARPRSQSRATLRASRDYLELCLTGRAVRLDWSEVTEVGQPSECAGGDAGDVCVTVAAYQLRIAQVGFGKRVAEAARLALAHNRTQRRLAESIPEGALSPAEEGDEQGDRGLSRADA